MGGCVGAAAPATPASFVHRGVVRGPFARASYPNPKSSAGNCKRSVPPSAPAPPFDRSHISATAALRAFPTGLSPTSRLPHCALPTAKPARTTSELNGSHDGTVATRTFAAAGGRPSAAGTSRTRSKLATLRRVLPTATGRRSRSYDRIRRARTTSGSSPSRARSESPGSSSSRPVEDAASTARHVAILHASACASWIPVFMPNPPAGGNLCAASPHSTTREFPVTNVSATSADIVHARTLRTSKSSSFVSPGIVPPPFAAASTSAAHCRREKSRSRLWCGGKYGICATNSPFLKSCATTTATTSGLKTKYSMAARSSLRRRAARVRDVKCTFTRCCIVGVPVIRAGANESRTLELAPSAATRMFASTDIVESLGSSARLNPASARRAVTGARPRDPKVAPGAAGERVRTSVRVAPVMNPSRPLG